MRKLLAIALLLVLGLVGAPAAAQTTDAPTPTPGGSGGTGGTGVRTGEIALGSIVAPVRTAAGRHGAATGLRSNPSCSVQCITSGVAYGRGPGARLVVTTDTPATIRIAVSRSGYYRLISSAAGQTSFSADFGDLGADTRYDAFVSAVDANGDIANRSGSFRTLQRNVDVVFNQAEVWETPYGDDAFYAQSWFEGVGGEPFAAYDLEDGILPLGVQVLKDVDTDRHLALALELKQHDEGVDVCEVEPDPPAPESGQGTCEYAATVWLADGALDLDDRPAWATNPNDYWISGTLVLPDTDALPGGFGTPLKFRVPTAVRVWFA